MNVCRLLNKPLLRKKSARVHWNFADYWTWSCAHLHRAFFFVAFACLMKAFKLQITGADISGSTYLPYLWRKQKIMPFNKYASSWGVHASQPANEPSNPHTTSSSTTINDNFFLIFVCIGVHMYVWMWFLQRVVAEVRFVISRIGIFRGFWDFFSFFIFFFPGSCSFFFIFFLLTAVVVILVVVFYSA